MPVPDDWDEEIRRIFKMYCDSPQTERHESDLLGDFKFAKLCKDCNLFDKYFTSNITGVLFAQVLKETGASRKIDIWGFAEALRLVAERKRVDVEVVWKSLKELDQPNKVFTKAESVPFHDDARYYTGTHKLGGPDGGGGYGHGLAMATASADMKALGLRKP